MNRILREIIALKEANVQQLKTYGFKENEGGFTIERHICGDEMLLTVKVDAGGEVSADVRDDETGDRYTLFLVEGSEGEFIGRVRAEYAAALNDIAEKCFAPKVFKSRGAQSAAEYALNKYGSHLEFLWNDTPGCAIVRRADNAKWYGVFMRIKQDRLLGCDGDPEAETEILNVRVDPEKIGDMLDLKQFFPAYHMNKKNWISVRLDGEIEQNELNMLIDASYIGAGGRGRRSRS